MPRKPTPPKKKKFPLRKRPFKTIPSTAAGVEKRLNELEFDPLEFSVAIAKGEALTTDHPFIDYMKDWVKFMQYSYMEKSREITMEDLDELLEQAIIYLSDSWVDHKLRSDHTKELMNYLYPKLKAVDHSGKINARLELKPLTKKEAADFAKAFNEQF